MNSAAKLGFQVSELRVSVYGVGDEKLLAVYRVA